eukprot:12621996-Ditylum_brightwellii.AAC.1
MDLGDEEDDDEGLEGFNKIASPFKTITHLSNPINFSEMGSLASRQAEAKNKAKSALSPRPKFSSKENQTNNNKSDNIPKEVCNSPSYKEMKSM